MSCPICRGTTSIFDRALVLGTYEAVFLCCDSCGFIHVYEPSWLVDAYACAITASDTGLTERNRWFAAVSRTIIATLFDRNGQFIDYGGGEGMYVSLMRQAGYDFYWYDKYAHNRHAAPFKADMSGLVRYELLTAVELFEHLADPMDALAGMLKLSPNILLTTHLLPDPPPPVGDWWYYGTEHGQHISWYSRKALLFVASAFSLKLTTNGRNLHLLSRKALPDSIFRLLTLPATAFLVNTLLRRPFLAGDVSR